MALSVLVRFLVVSDGFPILFEFCFGFRKCFLLRGQGSGEIFIRFLQRGEFVSQLGFACLGIFDRLIEHGLKLSDLVL